MILKVNHEELKNVTDVMLNDEEVLKSEVDKLLDYLEAIKLIWKGKDADAFYENAHEYISRMKIIPSAIGTFGNFINSVDNKYIENDDEFSNEINKEKGNMFSTEPPINFYGNGGNF